MAIKFVKFVKFVVEKIIHVILEIRGAIDASTYRAYLKYLFINDMAIKFVKFVKFVVEKIIHVILETRGAIFRCQNNFVYYLLF